MTTLTVPDRAAVAAALSDPPVFSVSIIQTKPGKFDAFVALQHEQFLRVRGQVQGVRGTRMLKSPEKGVVVLVTSFETAQDAERFRKDPRFTEHLERVQPLIERAEAMPVELAYEVGLI
jgi:heme-degrading monooxygenase HmoA